MTPARKYHFSDEEDCLIRDRYDSRTETIDELARLLRVPRWVIRHRASRLGVTRRSEPRWTPDDEAYLQANLRRLSVGGLARKLGRSPTAIALKAKRLGLRKRNGGYTLRSLALGFGVEQHAVARWVREGMLTARRRNSGRERDMYLISDRAVREFVRRHPLSFDVRRVDQLWFIDLLTNGLRR